MPIIFASLRASDLNWQNARGAASLCAALPFENAAVNAYRAAGYKYFTGECRKKCAFARAV